MARWIKKDAPGTVFVNTETGAKRQDTSKQPMFCETCEQRLSGPENLFRNRVLAAHFRGGVNFDRGEWLVRFVTSIALRVAIATLPSVAIHPPDRLARVEGALDRWRESLLSDPGSASPSEHELFFLNGRKVSPPMDVSAKTTAEYLIGGIDASIVASRAVVGVYSKLPAMLIWSPIEPSDRSGWRGTRVNGTGRLRANKQEVTSPLFATLFHERLRIIVAKRGLK